MDRFNSWIALVGDNRYLQAAAIVVVFVVAAKLIDWIACGLVRRWARHTKSDVDDKFIDMLHRPLFLSVVLFGLSLATQRLALPERVETVTMNILETIAIFIWLGFLARFCQLLLSVLSHYQDRFDIVQPRTLPLFDNLSKLLLFGGGIYALILAWDGDVTGWAASAGILGLAASFAAKDTLANLFAGVFIIADAPYRMGDFIILDTGERGRVTQIGLRSTRLLTRDDVEITIPNAVMGNTKIINETGGPHEKERIRIQVGVAYGSDIDQVRAVLLDIAQKHPELNTDPEPPCRKQADVNSDGEITISDASYLFSWLFLGGPTPPYPGPYNTNCASDPRPYISCDQSPCF